MVILGLIILQTLPFNKKNKPQYVIARSVSDEAISSNINFDNMSLRGA